MAVRFWYSTTTTSRDSSSSERISTGRYLPVQVERPPLWGIKRESTSTLMPMQNLQADFDHRMYTKYGLPERETCCANAEGRMEHPAFS
jgi:hypothetical protein